LGAILLQIWLILDKTDGLIARYRKSISSFGKFLEELNGAVVAALFFSSIGFAASKLPGFLPFQFKLPPYFFIIFGILTSFFIVFRHLAFRHFEIVFQKKESKPLIKSNLSKIVVKFSGVYSLAQPIFILAILFKFLGFYVLTYFLIHLILMLASIIILIRNASKITD
jgi:phosphatidylglycerophosphate synthase